MKKKFYLVESQFVKDCEQICNRKKLYDDENKAREFFNEEKKYYEKFAIDNEWEHEKSANKVEYFEQGYYAHNHAIVTFTELELER